MPRVSQCQRCHITCIPFHYLHIIKVQDAEKWSAFGLSSDVLTRGKGSKPMPFLSGKWVLLSSMNFWNKYWMSIFSSLWADDARLGMIRIGFLSVSVKTWTVIILICWSYCWNCLSMNYSNVRFKENDSFKFWSFPRKCQRCGCGVSGLKGDMLRQCRWWCGGGDIGAASRDQCPPELETNLHEVKFHNHWEGTN